MMGGRPKIKKPKPEQYQEVQVRDKSKRKVDPALKKLARKKIAKIQEVNKAEPVESVKPKNAISYLKSWNHREDTDSDWKYKKAQHIWLVKNWTKKDLVSDTDFEVFIEYMKGDKAKQKLIDQAKEFLDKEDEFLSLRAKNLIQSL
ncbi:hypothetical protein HDE_07448 [Halotydeus destructor]|nr:hypothetical protein HDE_07448 [Halotydeus destructor]